ncbi:MAG: alginate lyase family protein [Phycisphaerales bacterium]|nr:MAG: alginate lyase family protein [Phycisphaerales bacterium]
MGFNRVILKLRHDGPWRGGRRVLYTHLNRIHNRRRRLRWQDPDTASSLNAPITGFSPEPAMRLWPGAAERSWLAAAPKRWPELHQKAARQARDAAEGRFDLLGSGPVSVLGQDGRIRWHDDFKAEASFPSDCLYLDAPIWLEEEGSDIKVPWELSRFQHVFAFIWTDPDRYGGVFIQQWRDWREANPVARGVNWACTMDVAFRAISFTAALAAWGEQFDADTLTSFGALLAAHGHFIRDNLEWMGDARTNHYFTDIAGLAVLGAVLRPYPPAHAWLRFAARELRREINQQFALDGFNKECSTTYHRLVVELATIGYNACRVAGEELGETSRNRIVEAYRAIDVLSDASRNAPLIGDNDSARVFALSHREDAELAYLLPIGAALFGAEDLARGTAPPELALLCGTDVITSYAPAVEPEGPDYGRALKDAGLFVLGDRRNRMVIRCGPLSYTPVGGHRHLDQLSITLTVGRQPILVDPGQYCYTSNPASRDYYRSTAAHNTVEVDGETQSRVFTGNRMMYSVIDEARPRCEYYSSGERGGKFIGLHHGYRRLRGGSDHQRTVEYDAASRCWTVFDRLNLKGQHQCVWRFHLHPEVSVESGDGIWLLSKGDARLTLRWVSPSHPQGILEPGTYALAYGVEVETQVLVFRMTSHGPVEAQIELHTQCKDDT